MMLIELFVPAGVYGEEERRDLGRRLVTAIIGHDGAPESVLASARAMCQVIVHEPATWIVGDPAVDPADPPRFIVRMSVPGSWRKEMSAEVIARLTGALADADDDPRRLHEQSHAWVQVVGVPEGSFGTFGKAMSGVDVTRLITAAYRESPDSDAGAATTEPGTAIDPICGMTVALTDLAITLAHDGTTYGFCSGICRKIFTDDLQPASPQ